MSATATTEDAPKASPGRDMKQVRVYASVVTCMGACMQGGTLSPQH